jgi:hypothetical protein
VCSFCPFRCEYRKDLTKAEPGESGVMTDTATPPKEEQIDRQPSSTYCMYNVEHVFKTLAERHKHEETCPNRQEHERKYEQSQKVYHKHKLELKKN